jgi:hypothetical protein
MKRYFEIIFGCAVAGTGIVIAGVCVSMLNRIFGGTMWGASFGIFEVTPNNAVGFSVPILGFAVALIGVGCSIAFESNDEDG